MHPSTHSCGLDLSGSRVCPEDLKTEMEGDSYIENGLPFIQTLSLVSLKYGIRFGI